MVGGGIDFGKISLDVRYNLGLTSTDDSANEDDVKHRVFSFMIGYTLPSFGRPVAVR